MYSEEQLADFKSEKDAAIDDCTLISTKQDKLCKKYSPSDLLNILKQKCKDRFEVSPSSLKEGSIQKWKVIITIDGKPKGEGYDTNKPNAKQLASLNMLWNILPKGTTWNGAIKHITESKDPLHSLTI